MSTAIEQYTEANKQVKASKETRTTLAAAALDEARVAFFEKNPHVNSITWTQYTPYFNDGDSCTFSTGVDYAEFYDENGEEASLADDAATAIFAVLTTIEDEDYLAMFGDHQEVSMTAKGITSTEYEHD